MEQDGSSNFLRNRRAPTFKLWYMLLLLIISPTFPYFCCFKHLLASVFSSNQWSFTCFTFVLQQVDTSILGLSAKDAAKYPYIASMGVYVFKTDVLLKLLTGSYPSCNDFGSEIIPSAVKDHNVQVRWLSQELLPLVYSGFFSSDQMLLFAATMRTCNLVI